MVAQQSISRPPLLVAQMTEEWLNYYRKIAQVRVYITIYTTIYISIYLFICTSNLLFRPIFAATAFMVWIALSVWFCFIFLTVVEVKDGLIDFFLLYYFIDLQTYYYTRRGRFNRKIHDSVFRDTNWCDVLDK